MYPFCKNPKPQFLVKQELKYFRHKKSHCILPNNILCAAVSSFDSKKESGKCKIQELSSFYLQEKWFFTFNLSSPVEGPSEGECVSEGSATRSVKSVVSLAS